MIWLIILAVLLLLAGVVLMNYKYIKKHPEYFDWIFFNDGFILKAIGFIIFAAIAVPIIFNTFHSLSNDIKTSSTITANMTIGATNESTTITLPLPLIFDGVELKYLVLWSMVLVPVFFIVSRGGIIWVIITAGVITFLFPKMGIFGYFLVWGIASWYVLTKVLRIKMRRDVF
jgi:hypothetical protein